MLVDKREMFARRMAANILDAEWVHGNNQLAKRTKHLSATDTRRIIQLMEELVEQEPETA